MQSLMSKMMVRDDSRPRSSEPTTMSLNKGTPQKTIKRRDGKEVTIFGDDLATKTEAWFRITPDDVEAENFDPTSDSKNKVNICDMIDGIYGKKPGTADNPIVVSIVNLDQMMIELHAEFRAGSKGFSRGMMGWTAVVAGTRTSNGRYKEVAVADKFLQYVVSERIDGELIYYKPGEVPFESRLVKNNPQDVGDKLFVSDDRIMLPDAPCYIWRNGDTQKLVEWKNTGLLQFKLIEFKNRHIQGVCEWYVNAQTDLLGAIESIQHQAERAAKLLVPFSALEWNLFRHIEKIDIPGWGADMKGKSKAQRNLKKKTKQNGTVVLRLTQECEFKLSSAERARFGDALLIAAKSPVLIGNNSLFAEDEPARLPSTVGKDQHEDYEAVENRTVRSAPNEVEGDFEEETAPQPTIQTKCQNVIATLPQNTGSMTEKKCKAWVEKNMLAEGDKFDVLKTMLFGESPWPIASDKRKRAVKGMVFAVCGDENNIDDLKSWVSKQLG